MSAGRLLVIYSPNSTNAVRFRRSVLPQLDRLDYDYDLLPISDLPYFQAKQKIQKAIKYNDEILAAGGDGIVNVSLDAAITSDKNVIFSVLALGNFNVFARSINGSITKIEKINQAKTIDFYPLELSVNHHHLLYAAQYISLGVTARLTDYLNSDQARALRKRLRRSNTLFGMISALNYNKIFRNLSDISLPPAIHDGKIVTDNSLGFMLGPIGHYFSPYEKSYHRDASDFWFHHAKLTGHSARDVPYISSWFGRNLPGNETDYEEFTFNSPTSIVCQIGGDKLDLDKVSNLSVQRSQKSIRLRAPRLTRKNRSA